MRCEVVTVALSLSLLSAAYGAPPSVGVTAKMATPSPSADDSALGSGARADDSNPALQASSTGDLELSFPFEVPKYHGLEPKLGLAYTSASMSGFAGAGWSLQGFSTIRRQSAIGGAPHYDATDRFSLNGNRLLHCASAPTSPGCAAGGDFATEIETFTKIVRAADTWTVTTPDGTRTIYKPVHSIGLGVFQWGIQARIDLHGNRVDYEWSVTPFQPAYPKAVRYNGTVISLYTEVRPDPEIFSTGGASMATADQRLRSVDVQIGGVRARAYRLFYSRYAAANTFPKGGVTGDTGFAWPEDAQRSRLYTVRQYGRDAAVDAAGVVTGSTVKLDETRYGYGDRPDGLSNISPAEKQNSPSGIDGTRVTEQPYPANWCRWSASAILFSGDFNGDGVVDLGCYDPKEDHNALPGRAHGKDAAILLRSQDNRGNWTGTASYWQVPRPGWCEYGELMALDLNNDKRTDLACVNGDEMDEYTLSQGDSFLSGQYVQETHCTTFDSDPFGPWENCAYQEYCLNPDTGPNHCARGCESASDCPFGQACNGASFAGAGRCDPSARGRKFGCTPIGKATLDDGTPRTVCARSSGRKGLYFSMSDGRRFDSSKLAGTTVYSGAERIIPGDFDGDGLDDFGLVNAGGEIRVALAATLHKLTPQPPGAGSVVYLDFAVPALWAPAGFCSSKKFHVGDINGDGLADLYCDTGAVDADWVAFSNGVNSFIKQSGAYPRGNPVIGLADVDGDGRADLLSTGSRLLSPFSTTQVPTMRVGLSEGDHSRAMVDWFDVGPNGIGLADMRRDGRLGGFSARKTNSGPGGLDTVPIEIRMDALQSNRIVEVVHPGSGSGTSSGPDGTEVIRVRYAPLTQFVTGEDIPPRVVVGSISSPTEGETTYDYQTPAFDKATRTFRGFGTVTATNRFMNVLTITKTTSRLDPGLPYRPKRVEVRVAQDTFPPASPPPAGELRSTTDITYVTDSSAPYRNLVETRTERTYAGGKYRETSNERKYGPNGNITQEIAQGDTSIAGDGPEHITTRVYHPNVPIFLLDRVAVESTFSGIAPDEMKLLSRTKTYYDDSEDVSLPPVKGDVTRVDRWVSDLVFETTRMKVDASGNTTRVDAPDHGYVETTYDPTYHIFPLRVERGNSAAPTAAKLVSTTTWVATCGKPKVEVGEDKLSKTTDYDALCRPTRVATAAGWEEMTYCTTIPGRFLSAWPSIFGPGWSCPTGGLGAATRSILDKTVPPLSGLFTQPFLQAVIRERPASTPPEREFTIEFRDTKGRVLRTLTGGAVEADVVRTLATYTKLRTRASRPFKAGEVIHYTDAVIDPIALTKVITLPDGTTETDEATAPNTRVHTNAHGVKRTFLTRADGQVTFEKHPSNGVVATTRYDRDAVGRTIGLTDARGAHFSWTYDGLGRVTETVDPDHGTKKYDYTNLPGGGRRETVTQTRATRVRTCRSWFDVFGRPTTSTCQEGLESSSRASIYTGARLTSTTWPSGTDKLEYDPQGRPFRTTRTYTDVTPAEVYAMTVGFDGASRQAWFEFPDGDKIGGPTTPIEYDALGRPTRIPGIITSASYFGDGTTEQLIFAKGGVTLANTYDEMGRLDTVDAKVSGSTIFDLDYARTRGRVNSVSSTKFPAANRTYLYDDASRLKSQGGRTWHHDSVDALDSIAGDTIAHTETAEHAPSAIGTVSLGFDVFGQLESSSAAQTNTWDTFGQLKSANVGGAGLSFGYDRMGERAWSRSKGGVLTRYLSPDLRMRDGVLTKTLRLGGRIVAFRQGTTNFNVVVDHEGSVRLATDSTGGVALRAHYDAYGKPTFTGAGGAPAANPWDQGYIGERLDAAVGLMYLHTRYYHPVEGHFISADPSDPTGVSVGTARYTYAGGDPINYVDVGGRSTTSAEQVLGNYALFGMYMFGLVPRGPEVVGVAVSAYATTGGRGATSGGSLDVVMQPGQAPEGFVSPSAGFGTPGVGGRFSLIVAWNPGVTRATDVWTGKTDGIDLGHATVGWNTSGLILGLDSNQSSFGVSTSFAISTGPVIPESVLKGFSVLGSLKSSFGGGGGGTVTISSSEGGGVWNSDGQQTSGWGTYGIGGSGSGAAVYIGGYAFQFVPNVGPVLVGPTGGVGGFLDLVSPDSGAGVWGISVTGETISW